LNSWDWFPHWLRARAKDLDVLAPLTLLAVLIPCLVAQIAIARGAGCRCLLC
jgi:hypothetical protein